MILELNENEIDVLKNYLTRKTMRLEEAGLSDSKCCLAMNSILTKIYQASHEVEYDARKNCTK